MNKDDNYVDKTVLSTPEPTAASTEHKNRRSERYKELDNSLGIPSSKNVDLVSNKRYSNAQLLQQQRSLASSSLQKSSRLSSLPSRYLISSDSSKQNSESCINVSCDSTISESDLLKTGAKLLHGDSSTPRDSFTSDIEAGNRSRFSLGKSLSELSNKIKDTGMPLESFTEEFRRVMQSVVIEEDSEMFTPAEAVEEKLIADELSWRRKNDMPGQTSMCFSETSTLPLKMSMGEFFKLKSESISGFDIVAKSPEKKGLPIPLINDIPPFSNSTMNISQQDIPDSSTKESLSISKIEKILKDSEQTPRKAMNYLFSKEAKKNTVPRSGVIDISDKCRGLNVGSNMKNSTCMSSVPNNRTKVSDDTTLLSMIANKENVDYLNIQSIMTPLSVYVQSSGSSSADVTSISKNSPEPPVNSDRSIASVRTASSLSNLAGGKLPIGATRSELNWGCVKPGKSVTKEVVIKNKSQNRLRIQCALSGPSYKILKDRPESEFVSIAKYVLQPDETKTLTVSFAPIQNGAAMDTITFTTTDPSLNQYKNQRITLFGYGGYSNVGMTNVTKDLTGKFWLCLGTPIDKQPLTQTITVHNTGTLAAFGYFIVDSKDVFSSSGISVSPSKFVLLPQQQKDITITYDPLKNEFNPSHCSSRNNSIHDICVLRLYSGTEANRARIRSLSKQALEKQLFNYPLCNSFSEYIPGEAIPEDVLSFKESIRAVHELVKEISFREIELTIEQDPEATLVSHLSEDTLMFETLSQDTIIAVEDFHRRNLRLEPTCIILTPPFKTEDRFFLTSEFNVPVNYQIQCEPSNLIICHNKGTIQPSERIIIRVKCDVSDEQMIVYKVSVSVANCVLDAVVKVIRIS